tara:strand:+ start:66 stop:677 length:612 start_codon:yes stop_codon:yes gene_type:complete
MIQNIRKKNSNQTRNFVHNFFVLLAVFLLGITTTIFYQAVTSGEENYIGSNVLKFFLKDDAGSMASIDTKIESISNSPIRTNFDFYTVLPEIERVIPEPNEPDSIFEESSVKNDSKIKKSVNNSFYMLQTGTYRDRSQAELMKTKLELVGFNSTIQHISVQGRDDLFRVQIGPYTSMEAMEVEYRLLEQKKIRAVRLKVSNKN